jgi:hypothetical protein
VRESSEVVIIYPKMCKINHFKMFMGFPQAFDMLVYSSTGETIKTRNIQGPTQNSRVDSGL